MKHAKILRIFTIAVVLSLLLLIVPAMPALAISTTLSPTSGKIGDNINVIGDAFTSYKSMPTYDSYAEIWFAEDNVIVGKQIDIDVKTYKYVGESELPIDATTGDFSLTFQVPSQLDDYAVASYHDSVRAGTYYIYVTTNKYYLDGVTPDVIGKTIITKNTFTVTASAALDPLSPATGAAGTDVAISGANFPASTALVFKFDTTVITPKSGDTATRTSGIFLSTITVPASATAGAHTITVTAGTGTATASFTVTASAALDPLSPATGPAGTDVTVSGANFPASTALVFKHDTTTLPIKSGSTQTTSGGMFLSTITVPAGASPGAYIITVTAGTGTATATFTVTVAASAVIDISPESGPVGTEISITGANFPASQSIIFKIGGTTLTPTADNTTSPVGGFYSIVNVPAGTAAGDHIISVSVGATTLTSIFTVTGSSTPTSTPTATPTPPPTQKTVNVVQNAYNVGASLGIAGIGFAAGANVTIKYAGETIASAKVGNDTTFQVIFEIPALKLGVHQFTISDGVNVATANFTVETTPPPVPAPLTPETGAKVEIPITFDWTDVTDASLPVTYDFQIATNQAFAAGSIVLDKKALATSGFISTAADGLTQANGGANFWRVKAVDAALNESAWSSVFDFHTSGGGAASGLPGWVWPLIGSVGGVLLLFIGFWLGRRTAFYY